MRIDRVALVSASASDWRWRCRRAAASCSRTPTADGGARRRQTPRCVPAGSSARPRAARAPTARSAPARLCSGGPASSACYDPATRAPARLRRASPVRRPARALDEASCKARTDCRVDACPGCNGGSAFVRCAAPSDPPSRCPAIACPAPCARRPRRSLRGAARLPLRVRRHRRLRVRARSVAARASRAAPTAPARVCKAPAIICDAVTPYCEGPYVVSYRGSCYEGCVQATDCAVELSQVARR